MDENLNTVNEKINQCSGENYFKERAVELFMQGYNCSQSIFAAFCDECGIDFETALKISSSFGGGMGRMREVCGAASGMFIVAGMKYAIQTLKIEKRRQGTINVFKSLP